MVMPTEVDDAIIRPISTSMFEELHDFLETYFFPDAPLSASLGLSQRTQFWTWAWVRSCLMEEESIATLDPDTGRVIGVIIGKTSYLLVSSKLSLLLCKSLFLGHVNVWEDCGFLLWWWLGGVAGRAHLETVLVAALAAAPVLCQHHQGDLLWHLPPTWIRGAANNVITGNKQGEY